MNKISGILPSSSRITSVDLKESGAVRPGAPGYGRPSGESNIERNSVIRNAHRALQKHREQVDVRSKDQTQADIVQQMSDNFFKSQKQRDLEAALVSDILTEELTRVEPSKAPKQPALGSQVDSLEDLSQEEQDAPEVGRFLDVNV